MSSGYKVGLNPDWPAIIEVGVIYGPDKDDILVVNKPPGMDTFQTHYHLSGYPQLVSVVQEHYPDFAHAHRIDRTTSGAHAFGTKGRNGAGSLSILKSGWTTEVTKTYLAVVSGRPKWDEIALTMHVRHTGKQKSNLPCTTTLTNMGEGLIQAVLSKGGRNHQIRRALAAIDLPIIGDRLYKGAPGRRVMLHAWKWKFRDVEVQAQLPHDMEEWEPGGYNEPSWSIPVPPLSVRDMERLAKFRRENQGGTLGWPLPPDTLSPTAYPPG